MNTLHPSQSESYSRLPHRVALVLLGVVFPLIWVGGLVTTYDAGMAVPDWPNTYNYNMFAYPIRDWFLGPWDLFVEHGHRLLGSLSGILAIGLVAVAFWKDSRRWFRIVSISVLLLVIAQGLLGGARVVLDQRILAQIHGTVGPGFFAFVGMVVVMSGRWWRENRNLQLPRPSSFAGMYTLLATSIFVLSYLQLALGAAIRHVSETASTTYFNWISGLHVLVAGTIFLAVFFLFLLSRTGVGKVWGFRGTSFFLGFLVLIQVVLGLSTWVAKFGWPALFDGYQQTAHFVVAEKSFWQMNLITAHVAVGSLILATSAILTVKSFRVFYHGSQVDAGLDLANSPAASGLTA